jgi:hypothetical protein
MIGGNTELTIQVKKATGTNGIGESILTWETKQTLKGWLDYMSGEAKTSTFNAKILEATDVFVADYVALDAEIKPEAARAIRNGEIYEIKYIDNPMGLNRQLEIYLSYTGGQE